MRFGQNFHLYLVPEWAPFYVPYNLLKQLFKECNAKSISDNEQSDFSELYACLGDSIDRFNDFYCENCEFLTKTQAELQLKHELASRTWPMLMNERATSSGKENIMKAITDVRRDFEKLERYSRVNEEAIHRIFSKIDKSSGLLGTFHQQHKSNWKKFRADRRTRCAKFLEGFNALINIISQPPSDGHIELSTGKLCLEAFCDHRLILTDSSALYCAIKDDEPSTLADVINVLSNPEATSHSRIFLDCLAEVSVVCHFERCARYLLSVVVSRDGIALDHFLNNLIATTGRSGLLKRLEKLRNNAPSDFGNDDNSQDDFLVYTIDLVGLVPQDVFLAEDGLKRLPLHYAAQYGLTAICESVLRRSLSWTNGSFPTLVLSMDCRGCTPLHYAVIENHVETAKMLLSTVLPDNQQNAPIHDEKLSRHLGDLLIIAIRYQYDSMVALLQSYYSNICGTSAPGESPLYVAAQLGREDYVKSLLENRTNPDIEVPETLRGWTPLFIACVEGHQAIAKLLLQAGANQNIRDHLGWSAKEYAVFKGHIALAQMLHPWDNNQLTGGPACVPLKLRSSHTPPLRADINHVIVNLGILHNRKKAKAVDLKGYLSEKDLLMSNVLSMEISISTDPSANHVVELPILSDIVNEPFILPITEPNGSFLQFKLFRECNTREPKTRQLIGSAAILLEDAIQNVGPHRESLVRERTVPILEQKTLDVMGTATFTFVIAKPLGMVVLSSPPVFNPKIAEERLHFVGHRGLGQNKADHSHLQVGENTIESFLSAARQGACCVEFDVQLTRDLVPVIYHDLSLSESGTDVPIHDLTAEQFLHTGSLHSADFRHISGLKETNDRHGPTNSNCGKPRSRSLTSEDGIDSHLIRDRLKYTVDFKNKGFKPNTRGDFVQGPLTTLEELLAKLPETIHFNIEIKYPRFHETADAGVAHTAIEINTFIDKILERIFQAGRNRTIILSSFTPEICILLSIKQQTYPVMFITNAGKVPITDKDVRASSLQTAIHFSKKWNLTGIVLAAEPLILCPRLVRYIKRSGLICGSYGPLNNRPENAKVQLTAGLQILMVDRVGYISKALNG